MFVAKDLDFFVNFLSKAICLQVCFKLFKLGFLIR